MHARAAAALVHLGVAVGRLEALGTLAVEAVLLIHTRASVPAGAGRTLVDFHVALGTCERKVNDSLSFKGIYCSDCVCIVMHLSLFAGGLTSEARFADTVVAVDAVLAEAVVARVARAVVKVDLAVRACSGTAVLLFKRVSVQFLQTSKNIEKTFFSFIKIIFSLLCT